MRCHEFKTKSIDKCTINLDQVCTYGEGDHYSECHGETTIVTFNGHYVQLELLIPYDEFKSIMDMVACDVHRNFGGFSTILTGKKD